MSGLPSPFPPGMPCPVCNGIVHDVYQLIDVSRDTFGMVCPECGRLECDRDGAICRILNVRIERPPGTDVIAWNRMARAIEKAVVANHAAVASLLKGMTR